MSTPTVPGPPPVISEPEVPPPTPASIVARDFPRWVPPMLVKELRQGLRTRGFIASLIGFQIVMVIFTLVALSTQNEIRPNNRMPGTFFSGVFWLVLAVQLIMVTPARALGGLQQEVDSRTIDLLMLTRLTAWRVVMGKWFSLVGQATLLLVAMLPYLVVRYFTDSADILADLGRCGLMLVVSALLTAAALWGSGVGKLVRVLMAVGLGIVVLNTFGAVGAIVGALVGGPRPSFLPGLELRTDILNVALLGAFFLVSAVRNIAPPAENHGLFVRLLPVLALLAAPLAEAFGAHALALRQLTIAGVFLGLVLLFEFAGARPVMPTHWREWYRRGALSRALGRLCLPGWPSVLAFALLATAGWAGCALAIVAGATPASQKQAWHLAWLALLALSALTFPALVRSLLRERRFPPAIFYFFGLSLPAVASAAAIWMAESRWRFTGFRTVMETMPFSSFLFQINPRHNQPDFVLVAQGVVAVLVLAVALWHSMGYWRQLRVFEERDSKAAQRAVAKTAPLA
jgi:ABC-type transport system involved in multi-copper enzyme maturation permease subunit